MMEKYRIALGHGTLRKMRTVSDHPADDPWIEVSYAEWSSIERADNWQIIDNPNYGKVIGQRETPPGMGFKVGDPEAVIVEKIIDTRRRIIVPREPDPPTAEEIEAARCAAVRAGIRAAYSLETELSLINRGIADPKDAEYMAYRAAVAQIKENNK